MLLQGRLKGYQRMKLRTLFDMLYTPSELAREVGFTVRQIYRFYIPFGCPCVRDGARLFINGLRFAEWYEATYPKQVLLEDEAFCLTCKNSVQMVEPLKQKKGRLHYWVCKCAVCGRRLARIIDREKLH